MCLHKDGQAMSREAGPRKPAPPPPVDEKAALSDPDTFPDIRVEIDPGDWNALRVQARSLGPELEAL